MGTVATDFKALVDDPETSYDEIRDFLTGLTPEQRREAVEAIGGRKRQAKLYALAEAGPDLTLEDIVPDDRGALKPVIFYGKNSLPAFTIFQKRFCRPTTNGSSERLLGYNKQTMSPFTGPGYFRVRVAEDDDQALSSVAIDYTEIPDEKPDEWPPIKDNEHLPMKLVYGGMVDYLRPLSDDVFIGRAVRDGKVTDNYFLLARE